MTLCCKDVGYDGSYATCRVGNTREERAVCSCFDIT